ncbi:MAG: toll/interleukin-1 receptor domain-containing protein [Promethearchaeota archaeon]
MGKDKDIPSTYIHPEEHIHTIDKIPNNPERYFKYCIKQLEAKKIGIQGDQFEISEIGPQSDLSTTFELVGLNQATLEFTVRIEIASDKTEIHFGSKIELFWENMHKKIVQKLMKGSFKKSDRLYSSILVSYIKNVFAKSLDYINNLPDVSSKPMEITQTGGDNGTLVFMSYATKDAPLFRVKEIAEELTRFPEIFDVLYWQEDMQDNIIEYMNDNLGRCHVVLLFCSPNALESGPVKKEWTAADAMGKPILPIFLKPDHIPPLLRSRLGVEFDQFDFKNNITAIYELIIKKLN